MAWWYRQYAPNDATLTKLEAEAKAAEAAAKAARLAPPTAAEMKAARDARYAARKNRRK